LVWARGWCDKHYKRWRRYGDPSSVHQAYDLREGQAQKALAAILVNDSEECLFWPLSTNDNGYGVVRYAGRQQYVHRVVCEAINGPPPTSDHQASHRCHNGHLGCVTPKHLSWATPHENCAERPRIWDGVRYIGSRLTEDEARKIRDAYARGNVTVRELGEQFGISSSHAHNIARGKRWVRL
jgi:hypothetical protein